MLVRTAQFELTLFQSGAEANMDVPDDMESDEELPYSVCVPGAIAAIPPFSIDQLGDEVRC